PQCVGRASQPHGEHRSTHCVRHRGLVVAQRLAQANLITNKNLLPDDQPADWDRPSGLRMGTIEVTRLGMGAVEMTQIADWIARVLVERADPALVAAEVEAYRTGFQTLYYTFDAGLPPIIEGTQGR
ncbi:MAG: hypothetical protein HGA19_15575, partial [Oscillochloris sp.]|nr:hypothetical protein [Oscillochloris sp.]